MPFSKYFYSPLRVRKRKHKYDALLKQPQMYQNNFIVSSAPCCLFSTCNVVLLSHLLLKLDNLNLDIVSMSSNIVKTYFVVWSVKIAKTHFLVLIRPNVFVFLCHLTFVFWDEWSIKFETCSSLQFFVLTLTCQSFSNSQSICLG